MKPKFNLQLSRQIQAKPARNQQESDIYPVAAVVTGVGPMHNRESCTYWNCVGNVYLQELQSSTGQ